MRKKMVDGKGGNLKTIHHYKLKGFSVTTPPFRLYLRGSADGKEGKPSTDLQSTSPISAPAASFRKEKGYALVPVFFPLPCFGPFFRFGFRKDLPGPLPILSQKKIILMNPAEGNIVISSLAALRIILLFFSFHKIIHIQFLWPEDGSQIFSWYPLPASPPGHSPFRLNFSKSDANKTALSGQHHFFWDFVINNIMISNCLLID
jgi:hypothetical protein